MKYWSFELTDNFKDRLYANKKIGRYYLGGAITLKQAKTLDEAKKYILADFKKNYENITSNDFIIIEKDDE
jgi:hypothetical protein